MTYNNGPKGKLPSVLKVTRTLTVYVTLLIMYEAY